MAYRLTDTANGGEITDPESWLEARWGEFTGLWRRILDLQHRAAEVAAEAKAAGDLQRHAQAAEIVEALGDLAALHTKVVQRLEGFGLGGLPFVAVGALGFSALATLALWIMRKYEAEAEKLRMIEEGTLTPDEAAALDPGPMPGGVLRSGLGTLVPWLLLGAVAWALLPRLRRNPELMMLGNPGGGDFGAEVHRIEYRHAEDGRHYYHDFKNGVRMDAEPDGSVRLSHPSRPVWAEFE